MASEKGGYRTGGKHEPKSDYGFTADSKSCDIGASGAGMGNQQFNQDGDGAGGIGSTGTKSNSSEK